MKDGNFLIQRYFVYQKSLIRIFHTRVFTMKYPFVTSQRKNTNLKSDFVLKTVLNFSFKDF